METNFEILSTVNLQECEPYLQCFKISIPNLFHERRSMQLLEIFTEFSSDGEDKLGKFPKNVVKNFLFI